MRVAITAIIADAKREETALRQEIERADKEMISKGGEVASRWLELKEEQRGRMKGLAEQSGVDSSWIDKLFGGGKGLTIGLAVGIGVLALGFAVARRK